MIKQIVTLPFLLNKPSVDATLGDLSIGQDLMDTLAAHTNDCVGMAANMIGERKRIIVFHDEAPNTNRLMFNPEIVKQFSPYQTSERCLSLKGERPTTRYKKIVVRYQDGKFNWHEEIFSDFTAQIIQHEIDHCNGILI